MQETHVEVERMMVLDFVNDIDVTKVDNIMRFQKERRLLQENLSSHQWWVGLFASHIAERFFITTDKIRKTELMLEIFKRGLYHDLPEIFTGDVDHNMKYNPITGDRVRELIEETEKYYLGLVFGEESDFYKSIFNASHPLIPLVNKIGDWLACIKQTVAEVSLGNFNMKDTVMACVKKLDKHLEVVLSFEESAVCHPADEYDWDYIRSIKQNIVFYTENYWINGKFTT